MIVPMASADAIYHSNLGVPDYWWVLVMAGTPRDASAGIADTAADLIVKRTTASARPQLTPKDLPQVSVGRQPWPGREP